MIRVRAGVGRSIRIVACGWGGRHGWLRMVFKVPLLLSPQAEGGYTVTSPVLPELVTEGDTVEEALANARDAFEAVTEAYQDLGKSLPPNIQFVEGTGPLWLETVVTVA